MTGDARKGGARFFRENDGLIMKRYYLMVGAASIGLSLAAAGWHLATRETKEPAALHHVSAPGLVMPVVDATGLSGFDEREQIIIKQLRKKFPEKIGRVALQVLMIANLMDLLRQLYPDDWEPRLRRILAAAFPAQATALRDSYLALTAYNHWLKDGLPQLVFPTHEARMQALWNKRISLFGNAAYEIWALERREMALADTLKSLASSPVPFAEKADTYLAKLHDTYGDKLQATGGGNATLLMTRFLEIDSVQRDLKTMSAEERQRELRQFRHDIGLDDAALDRWQHLDSERDTNRQAGDRYMAARAQLEKNYQGEALATQITDLQKRMFGDSEATFIRNEEASGYFRFSTPQKIGLD